MTGRIHHRRHPDGMFDVIDGEGHTLVSLLCSSRVERPTLVVAAVIEQLEQEADGQ